jgi:putative PIN family toxin of toxin-antitoxin system
MIAAVFDTNVVISGLLSPDGSTGRVLDAMVEGLCHPVVTDRILAEYEEVLCHPKFRFPMPKIHLLLDAIRTNAVYALYVPVIHATTYPTPMTLFFLKPR